MKRFISNKVALDFFVGCVITIVGALDIYCKYVFLPECRHSIVSILALGCARASVVVLLILGLLKAGIKIVKWVGVVLFEFYLLISSIEIWMQYNFHMALAGSWLPLLMNSSRQEVLEFFHNYFSAFSFCGSFFCWVLIMITCSVAAIKVSAFKMRYLAGGFLCVAYVLNGILGLAFHGSMKLSAETFWQMTRREYAEEKALKECREYVVPDGMTAKGSVLGVIIIGESATRNHMSLYGYPRKTTPRLDSLRDEFVLFSNFRASAIDTRMALRYMFTEATATNKSFIGVTLSKSCKCTNTHTTFISNQGHWTRAEALEELLFYFSEKKIFMADLGLKPPVYDDAVLGPFRNACDEYRSAARSLIVVHLYGSHVPVDGRYPKANRVFADDLCDKCSEMIPSGSRRRKFNQYDNSIAFTDSVCGDIIDNVKATDRSAFVLYLSDHGESPSSNGWRVATDRDCWEVPLVIWTSELFRSENPDIMEYLERHKDDELTSVDMFNLFHKLLLIGGYEKQN